MDRATPAQRDIRSCDALIEANRITDEGIRNFWNEKMAQAHLLLQDQVKTGDFLLKVFIMFFCPFWIFTSIMIHLAGVLNVLLLYAALCTAVAGVWVLISIEDTIPTWFTRIFILFLHLVALAAIV